VKNGTWLAVLLSSTVAVLGFATPGHSLRGVYALIASKFSLKALVGFLARYGATSQRFPTWSQCSSVGRVRSASTPCFASALDDDLWFATGGSLTLGPQHCD
jgi:hypothetical protein